MSKSRIYLKDVSIVDFYGKPIFTGRCEETGEFVVPLKHIVEEHLGLTWTRQREKLQESPVFREVVTVVSGKSFTAPLNGCGLEDSLEHRYHDHDIPVFSPGAEYVCLPLKFLNLFLCQINILRVKEELQEGLLIYQTECGQALHDYWMHGAAVNNRENPHLIDSDKRPDDRSPRHWTTSRLIRSTERYARFAGDAVSADDILNYVKTAVYQLIDVDDETWDDPRGYVEYIVAFMERAASEILFMCIDAEVYPEELEERLNRNLLICWENMGNSVLAVQSPYNAFPGAGIGASRELK